MEIIFDKLIVEIIKSLEVYFDNTIENNNGCDKVEYSLYQYLLIISIYEGITQNELTQKANVKKSALSKSVKKMFNMGLVEIKSDEYDGRMRKLYLTKKGLEKVCDFKKTMKKMEERIFKGFSKEQREYMTDMMFAIYRNIDDENSEYADYLEKAKK